MTRRRKLIVIGLEGLSAEQAAGLLSRVDTLRDVVKDSSLRALEHKPVSSYQSVWAELLWGKPWFQLGVPGYARVAGSLNEVTPVSEDHFGLPCKLLVDAQASVVVNVPLLQPHENRLWLSDGAGSSNAVPLELSEGLPEYRPRPFQCIALGTASLRDSIKDCLAVEKIRLEWATRLLKSSDWHIAIVRLSAFDLLAHLLGADFLSDRELQVQDYLSILLDSLNLFLAFMSNNFPESYSCIMSTIKHKECIARVNLNKILQSGGFCQLEPYDRSGVIGQRRSATLLLRQGGEQVPDLAITPTWAFALPKTLAGSPTEGAIYLNVKDRFSNGQVAQQDVPRMKDEVKDLIRKVFRSELGCEPQIWEDNQRSRLSPDLMIYGEGLEFHNSCIGPAIDRINKPRTAHSCEGFFCLPNDELESASSRKLSTLELHEVVYGAAYK